MRKGINLIVVAIMMLMLLQVPTKTIAAAGESVSTFSTSQSTSRDQTQTFTIPGMTQLRTVTTNTGSVSIISTDGNKVTIKAINGTSNGSTSVPVHNSGGTYTHSQTAHPNSAGSLEYKSYDGYTSGTLTKKQVASQNVTTFVSMYQCGIQTDTVGNSLIGRSVGMADPHYSGWTPEVRVFPVFTSGTITSNSMGCPSPGWGAQTMVEYGSGDVQYTSERYVHEGTVTTVPHTTYSYTPHYKYDLTFTYITDNVSPEIKLTIPNTSSTNGGVKVKASVTDDNSGVMESKWELGDKSSSFFATGGNELSEEFTAFENGTYTVYAKDIAGNEATSKVKVNSIDTSRVPVPKITVSTTKETSEDVLVTIAYSETAVKKEYSRDGITWSNYTKAIKLGQNTTLWAKASNASGNVSPVAKVVINNITKVAIKPPKVKPSSFGPTRDNVELAITYPDNATKKQVLVNGSGWKSYDAPIVMDNNGVVKSRALDSAGNISSVSTVKISNIDKEIPELLVTGIRDKGVYSGQATFNIQVYDRSQYNVEVKLNGKKYYDTVVSKKGKHSLDISVTDVVGNTTKSQYEFTVK